MSDEINDQEEVQGGGDEIIHKITPISGMYENWFLDYASYVILERAVPAIEDGLKPVQRRILHSMKEKDDGRYNKVANIIGHTMQYHPHGDAAIGAAMVNLGQKDLLIDTQGNWGDIRTGDNAAAARYIESRLSKLALDVVFNPQTTHWQASYDGRNKEPITLPVKFPLLLAQGVEGIAVGLATKIMPHNFCELCEASIKHLQGKRFKLYPDFPTGGMVDVENYNDGLKGGKVRVRAKIEKVDSKTLIIRDIPFSTTTTNLIDTIIKANDQGKIKIKKVIDNTAKDVEILIDLAPGVSPDVMIDALYAFTDCELSISPNSCVIVGEKPEFLPVTEILRRNTDFTVELLKRELEIRKAELMEKILFSSLEKIFIQEEMYINFKEYDNKPDLFKYLDERFEPFKPQFFRELTDEDFDKLTQIPMIRITRFDSAKADEKMKGLEDELAQVNHHLAHLIEYAIAHYERLLEKYGKGKERKTEIRTFDTIQAQEVVVNNAKLYVNRAEGFIGTGLKKDEFVEECSDIDDIISFRRDGKMMVSRIADKVFVGKDIVWTGVWKKGDDRMVYNLIYLDGKSGRSMVKRFQVTGITRDKEYDLTKGDKKSKLHYMTANPNGEAEVVTVYLTSGCNAKKKVFDFDFADIEIKGRGAGGNILTKYPVRKIDLKTKGVSTLSGIKIWYDSSVGKLNSDERGQFVGEFNGDDNVMVLYKDGSYELTSYELTNRYDSNKVVVITKYDPDKVVSCVYYDGGSKNYYVKRFKVETSTLGKNFIYISEEAGSKLMVVSVAKNPRIELTHRKDSKSDKKVSELSFIALIEVKGWKAMGNKLTSDQVLKVKLIEDEEPEDNDDDNDGGISETEVVPEEEKKVDTEVKEKALEKPKVSQKETDNSKPKAEGKKSEPEKEASKTASGESGLKPGDKVEFDLSKKKKNDDKGDGKDQLNLF